MVDISERHRISKELGNIIRDIKIEAMKKGKKAPSTREITKKIAKKLREDDLLMSEFLRFR